MKYSWATVSVQHAAPGVAVIMLSRPPLNPISWQMDRELLQAVRSLDRDRSVHAVVIAGSGTRAFSVGADIHEMRRLASEGRAKARLKFENAVFDALEHLGQPTVAALEGCALGGGLELALCCDFRVMAASASLALPEIGLGVFPGSGGVMRLPRIIGEAHAKSMIFLGESVDAHVATQLGLATRVVPEGQALAASIELAQELANLPALALQTVKAEMRISRTRRRAGKLIRSCARLFTSADAVEGLGAFVEKRQPNFARLRDSP